MHLNEHDNRKHPSKYQSIINWNIGATHNSGLHRPGQHNRAPATTHHHANGDQSADRVGGSAMAPRVNECSDEIPENQLRYMTEFRIRISIRIVYW